MAIGDRVGTGYVDIEPELGGFFKKLDAELAPLNDHFKAASQDAAKELDRGLGPAIDRTGKRAKAADKDVSRFDSSLDRLNIALGNSTHNTKLFGDALNFVKPAALITGVGILSQALSAAAAGGIALVGALAPAAGIIAAYPTLASAAAQGMGTWRLATLGLDEALKPLTEDLQKPSPLAERLASKLAPLADRITALRDAAQKPIFAAIEKNIDRVVPLFGIVRHGINLTGQSIGKLIDQAAALVSSKGFGKDLETQMGRNAKTISILGGAGLSLAVALRHVVLAAGPLVTWLTRVVAHYAKLAAASVKTGRKTGDLGDFFEKTRVVIQRLITIGASLAKAFFNIAKAGAPLGRDLLDSITKNAQRFAAWTESASGKNAIAQFFKNAREPIYEVGKLIRDATKAFFSMSQGSSVAPLLHQLRTQLLPVVEALVKSTAQAFGPHLINALTQVAVLFGSMAGSSGPLVLFVDLVGQAAKVLNFLIGNNPALQSMLVTLAGTAAVIKVLKFGSFITGLSTVTKAVNALKVAYIAETGAQNASAIAAIRWRIATAAATVTTYAQRAAVIASTIAQKALNLAVRTNPYILAATALIALGAAVVVAYNKSESFRNTVNDVRDALIDFWHVVDGPVIAALKYFFAVAKERVLGIFQIFKGTFTAIKGIVDVFVGLITLDFDQAGKGIKEIFSGVATAVLGVFRTMFAPIIALVKTAGGAISSGFRAAVGGVVDAAKWAFNAAHDVLVLWLTPYRVAADKIGQAVNLGFGGARAVVQFVGNVISDAHGKITAALQPFRNAAGKVAAGVVAAFDVVKTITGRIAGFLSDAANRVLDFAGSFFNKAKTVGQNIVDGLAGAVGKLPGAIKSAFGSLGGLAGDIGRMIADWINANTPFGDEIKIDIPKGPDISVHLPALYKGTDFFKGGVALVGERGPELVSLPRGAAVADAERTRSMLRAKVPTPFAGIGDDFDPALNVDVWIGGEKIDERVEARFRRMGERLFGAGSASTPRPA